MKSKPFFMTMPAVAAALLMVIVGCGSGDNTTPSVTTPPRSASAAATATPQAIAGLSAGQTIKIGALLTQSGSAAINGQIGIQGVQLAVDEINAAGGIAGHKIELVAKDDGGDATQALTITQELVTSNHVQFIVGPILSTAALAILPYTTEQKIPNVGPYAADTTDKPAQYPYGFSVSPVTSSIASAVLQAGLDHFSPTKVGVIADNGARGVSSVASLTQSLHDKGFTDANIAVQRYEAGAQDLQPQIQALKDAGVGLVIPIGVAGDLIRLFRTVIQLGWNVPITTDNAILRPETISQIGTSDQLNNVYAVYLKNETYGADGVIAPQTAALNTKLKQLTGKNPLETGNYGYGLYYDIVYTIKSAIESAHSIDPDKFKAAMETSLAYDGSTAHISYTADRHSITTDQFVLVKVGAFKDGLWERLN